MVSNNIFIHGGLYIKERWGNSTRELFIYKVSSNSIVSNIAYLYVLYRELTKKKISSLIGIGSLEVQ